VNVVAVIPARGGSQRLPRKNVLEVFGKPMIVWAIEACRRAPSVDAVFVSSEDGEVRQIAAAAGAQIIPRPDRLAADDVPKIEVIRHADQWLFDAHHCHPHSLISVQANSPEVLARDLESAVEMLQRHRLWEVTSIDERFIQNGAFRLIRQHSLYNTFLSAHLGVVPTDYLDIHTEEDLAQLHHRYPTRRAFEDRIAADADCASAHASGLSGELATTLDDYAISRELYRWILDNVERDRTILEFGSGSGSRELARHYRVYSVEHDRRWLGLDAGVNYIHAPLTDYGEYEWYNVEIVRERIPSRYDLIIVDGPPNNPRTSVIGRKGFVDNIHLFHTDVPIVFDDVNRPEERHNMHEVARRLNKPVRVIKGWQKDFGIVG